MQAGLVILDLSMPVMNGLVVIVLSSCVIVDNCPRLFYKRHSYGSTGGFMSGIIWWLIVGGIAGLLAGVVMKGGGYGVVADIILGILGAFLGGWIFGMLGLGAGGGMVGSIFVAFIGACILIGITRMLKRA